MAGSNLDPISVGQPPRPNPFTSPSTIDLSKIASDTAPVLQNGVLKTENDDGSLTVDFKPKLKSEIPDDKGFYANLAEHIEDGELSRISAELLDGIQRDDDSRREWLETRARGISLLGLKLNEPKGEATSEGVSTVQHPLLLEATLRFQANARGELLPASGPVKIRNDSTMPPKVPPAPPPPPPMMGHNGGPPMGGPMPPAPGGPPMPGPMPGMPQGGPPPMPPPPPQAPPPGPGGIPVQQPAPTDLAPPPAPAVPAGQANQNDQIAQALETDMNHYLTVSAPEYYPDTDRMLFWIGSGGLGVKKVYNCPIRRRPVSESVDAENLIVENASTDLENCGRITHRIKMRPSTLKRMQLLGAYRDIELTAAPTYQMMNAVEREKSEINDIKPQAQRPQDAEHEIYECYCELNISGLEHKDKKGKESGLQLPYVVTIHKESRQVLQVRRNWEEEDDLCLSKPYFVDFPFVRAVGFYGIGLINILGNTTAALTAAWRIVLDSGMFANFPGFVYQKQFGRQLTNQFRIAPGSGVGLDTGGMPINQAVMPLPYKEAGAGFINFITHIEEVGQRVGNTADLQIGEGKQDAPVGTTLALIEQATKTMDAVHKRLHSAQAREFQLLKARFKEDPEAFWRFNPRPAMPWQKDQFLEALNNVNMVPVSDPNNPTSMHRIAKATVIKTLQQASPQLYDPIAVDERIMRIAGIDPEGLFKAQPAAPPPDPSLIAAQAKAKSTQDANQMQLLQMQLKTQIQQQQSADKAADRASRERLEEMKLALERLRIISDKIVHADNLAPGEDVNAQTVEVLRMLADHSRQKEESERQIYMTQMAEEQARHDSEAQAEERRNQAMEDRAFKHEQAARDREHKKEQAEADREMKREAAREANAAKVQIAKSKPKPKPAAKGKAKS